MSTIRIGRAVLSNTVINKGLTLSGTTLTVPFEIVGTDANEMKAIRQQLAGHLNNADEQIIPFTWNEDATLDGFYTLTGVSIPSTENMLNVGYIPGCTATLEQMPGFATPISETIVQSVVRANAHGLTVPPSVVAVLEGVGPESEIDYRPDLTSVTAVNRPNSDGQSVVAQTVATSPAPVAVTQYRAFFPPAYFYYGAARVEVKYGSTWYQVVGRNVPANSVWRISNGCVRLTSANGATSGTLEVWDNSVAVAWESANVSHWTNGAVGPGIGQGDGAAQAKVSILRNSPEQVTVRCGTLNGEWTYTIQRGAHLVTASWTTLTATKFGAGYTTAGACTAVTGGIRLTSNDPNGNRLVFSMPVAQTTDLTNGGTNAAVAATSGTVGLAVQLAGSAAIAGNQAADLVNQFIGATSWLQRVVPR